MPALSISNSVNIASLDSHLGADLCTGIFYIDVVPSIFLGSGATNVMGASVKITNPYGVIIKNYPTSGYDIYAPMTSVVQVQIPTQANNYQYGNYTVDVQLTDSNGTKYVVTKQVSICAPDPKNKTHNYGSLSATLDGSCKEGKLYVQADTVPVYKGAISNAQVNAFTLEYPTSSGLAVLNTSTGNFSAVLFEGVYKFKGTICANYDLGDNVYAKVNYKVKKEKNIRCLLDYICIAGALQSLHTELNSDCTEKEKEATLKRITGTLYLLKVIDVTINAGFDASGFIDELEVLLGCVCTCNCADGTPIINNSPAKDFSITGCNVSKTTVGLTDTYLIDNYEYKVAIADNGGILTVSTPALAGCIKTQSFVFNISKVYEQIKAQIANVNEFSFWGSVLNKTWDGLNIACLGVTQQVWNAASFTERSQIVVSKLCDGGTCNAQITAGTVVNTANDVTVNWNNISGVYEVAAYLDGVLAGTVLAPATSFKYSASANGVTHTWTLVSKCTNGSIGNSLNGTFLYLGCPTIAPPVLSASSISTACPYDLTSQVAVLPTGITAEWHKLNNTLSSSLVSNPVGAVDGAYFVFAKNAAGCYSLPAQFILTCATGTNCSAPQNLLVTGSGGFHYITFDGAAYPPPANSYTVKRRLTSTPDISGSYTTLGAALYSSSAGKWSVVSLIPTNNTLYTYKAVSNCGSTEPFANFTIANFTCPVVTLTPGQTTLGYSFVPVGGDIDKYEVEVWSGDGSTFIDRQTIVPTFSSPITGTFIYLTGGTPYQVKVRPYIGTYSRTCMSVTATTTPANNFILSAAYGMSISSVSGTGVPSLAPTGTNGTVSGIHTAMSGTYTIVLTGTPSTTAKLDAYVNGVIYNCIAVPTAGTYTLPIISSSAATVTIAIDSGTC